MNPDTAPPYVEIKTLFERRQDFTVNTEKLRRAEFGQIDRWLVTEKIDGTNIRVSLENIGGFSGGSPGYDDPDQWVVRIGGRTNNAQIPPFLLTYLQETFTLERMQGLWRCKTNCDKCDGEGRVVNTFIDMQCPNLEPYPITLYGEGYGERIQKGGGNYRSGVSFRLFDVFVGGKWWLDWANICDIAERLDIRTVPMLNLPEFYHRNATRDTIVDFVRAGFASTVAAEERGQLHEAEGVVARTDPYLYDKHGTPLKFKLKAKDFRGNK